MCNIEQYFLIQQTQQPMIPKEKTYQRAKDTNKFLDKRVGHGYQTGFVVGVKFAESELKDLACEFAEWVDNFGYRQIGNSVWCRIDNIHRATSELFAKFLAERSKQ